MLRKHFRIRRIVIGLAFAALAAPAGASAAGTFVDGGPVPVSHASTPPQIRTEHSASVITPLQADGLRWQAMADFYGRQQGLKADGLRYQAMADFYARQQVQPIGRFDLRAQQLAAQQPTQATSERSNGVPGPNPSLVPQVVASTSNGFDWRDAGIGASTAFGVALLLVIGVALVRRNQHAGLTRA